MLGKTIATNAFTDTTALGCAPLWRARAKTLYQQAVLFVAYRGYSNLLPKLQHDSDRPDWSFRLRCSRIQRHDPEMINAAFFNILLIQYRSPRADMSTNTRELRPLLSELYSSV